MGSFSENPKHLVHSISLNCLGFAWLRFPPGPWVQLFRVRRLAAAFTRGSFASAPPPALSWRQAATEQSGSKAPALQRPALKLYTHETSGRRIAALREAAFTQGGRRLRKESRVATLTPLLRQGHRERSRLTSELESLLR